MLLLDCDNIGPFHGRVRRGAWKRIQAREEKNVCKRLQTHIFTIFFHTNCRLSKLPYPITVANYTSPRMTLLFQLKVSNLFYTPCIPHLSHLNIQSTKDPISKDKIPKHLPSFYVGYMLTLVLLFPLFVTTCSQSVM